MAKKSFSLIELIFTIVLVSIIISQLIPKNNFSKLSLAADKIILYLKYTRYIAMIDNKFDSNDTDWKLERWTIKFRECTNKARDGIYYNIYSDTNHGGKANKTECLKDPITNKYIYSLYCREDTIGDKSKYVLLKEFGVTKIEMSCYSQGSSKTIGKISFGNDGRIYYSTSENKDVSKIEEIIKQCTIKLYDLNENNITIAIEPVTGYIYRK